MTTRTGIRNTEPRRDGTATELEGLLPSFRRHLLALNRSPRTVQSYEEAVRQLAAFLGEEGLTTSPAELTRRDIEAFELNLLERFAPATAANRHRSLRSFFSWCRDEGEVETSPMDGLSGPRVPVKPVPVLSAAQLSAFLAACEGSDFRSRRDTAIARVFIDTGARLSEVAGLAVVGGSFPPVSLDARVLYLLGKGQRTRLVPIGDKTVQALDRYLRARNRHSRADEKALWLGSRGAFSANGIRQMVYYRARAAGIEHCHPHMFRHTFASNWLSAGGSEGDLMQICGWSSREMLDRYGSSAASERAIAAHHRLSLGDRL